MSIKFFSFLLLSGIICLSSCKKKSINMEGKWKLMQQRISTVGQEIAPFLPVESDKSLTFNEFNGSVTVKGTLCSMSTSSNGSELLLYSSKSSDVTVFCGQEAIKRPYKVDGNTLTVFYKFDGSHAEKYVKL